MTDKTPEIRYPGYDDEWGECKLNNFIKGWYS